MFDRVRSLVKISRAEFILPNLGSLILGLAWGARPTGDVAGLVLLVVLSFVIINLSSAIGAQINTHSDYDLDSRDERKRQLVQAVDVFGRNRLKGLLIAEFLLTLVVVFLFVLMLGRPMLLLMWIVGIFLGWAYSAPPLRLKGRSVLAPVSLVLVLAVFPVMFAYFSFASMVDPLFLLSLGGLGLTVYAVIIPTEIRDYFGDKARDIETLTVRLGLVKASLLSLFLLATGAVLIGTAFFLRFIYGGYPLISLFVVGIPIAVLIVLRKFGRLYALSREYVRCNYSTSIADEIVGFSANNPRWIMLVTQTYSFISVVLLIVNLFL